MALGSLSPGIGLKLGERPSLSAFFRPGYISVVLHAPWASSPATLGSELSLEQRVGVTIAGQKTFRQLLAAKDSQ